MSSLDGPVLVVGTGLLGTSVALAVRRTGIEVWLSDVSPDHLRTATGLGAGRAWTPGEEPQVVVVAVPPDHVGTAVAEALDRTGAVVTDVGSIKVQPLREVREHPGVTRYVGGHPLAGSERSGPLAATAALFDARPWAVTPHEDSSADAVALVEELALVCGAVPVRFTPEEHDEAVARTSHLPHLMSVLMAGRLVDAPADHLALAGQGVRDVTRIAASDPALWQQIVAANSRPLLMLLRELREDLDHLMWAVEEGSRDHLAAVLDQGVVGTRAIPGKHGGPVRATASVFVSVPDHPGELARLFADVGEAEVNVEDLRIDHDPGRDTGLVELVVAEASAPQLVEALQARGWTTHG